MYVRYREGRTLDSAVFGLPSVDIVSLIVEFA